MNTPTASQKPGRLNALLSEYGAVAIVVYFSIFFLVLFGFAWAISRGFGDVIDGWMAKLKEWFPWLSRGGGSSWFGRLIDGLMAKLAAVFNWLFGSSVGIWLAAYVATKLTQPLRLAATLALTPLVGSLLRRFDKSPRAEAASDELEADRDPPPADPS